MANSFEAWWRLLETAKPNDMGTCGCGMRSVRVCCSAGAAEACGGGEALLPWLRGSDGSLGDLTLSEEVLLVLPAHLRACVPVGLCTTDAQQRKCR